MLPRTPDNDTGKFYEITRNEYWLQLIRDCKRLLNDKQHGKCSFNLFYDDIELISPTTKQGYHGITRGLGEMLLDVMPREIHYLDRFRAFLDYSGIKYFDSPPLKTITVYLDVNNLNNLSCD